MCKELRAEQTVFPQEALYHYGVQQAAENVFPSVVVSALFLLVCAGVLTSRPVRPTD